MALNQMKTYYRHCTPNAHGWIEMRGDEHGFVVTTPDDEDGTEFDSHDDAAKFYFACIREYADKPNWRRQGEYDQFWR